MGWRLLAAVSAALFIVSGLIYWSGTASTYVMRVAPRLDAFAISPGGDYFAITYADEVSLYSSDGVLEWSRSLAADACAVSFSHDSGKLAVFAGDRLYFLSVSDGSVVREVALTLSCAPSSSLHWVPGGDAVLVNARGRLAYVTLAGRGEVTPYVGLTITRLRWVSDAEALAIDDYGDAAYFISVAPLTINVLAAYGESGSADFLGGGVFVISGRGWAALILPSGPAYNESLGDEVIASDISSLGFAVVGDRVLAIDPGNGDVVWGAGLGYAPSSAEVWACGDAVATEATRWVNGTPVAETHVFVGGEDVLARSGLQSGSEFLAWFGDCSGALILDPSEMETYILRMGGGAEALGGIYIPVSRVGNSLITYKYERESPFDPSGAYIMRPDGSMEPLIKLDYSVVHEINERTILVVSGGTARLVKLGEAPPQYSWAWYVPALLGVATSALGVRAWFKERKGGD